MGRHLCLKTQRKTKAQGSVGWELLFYIRQCLLCGFFAGYAGGHRGKGGLWEEFAAGRHHWGAAVNENVLGKGQGSGGDNASTRNGKTQPLSREISGDGEVDSKSRLRCSLVRRALA